MDHPSLPSSLFPSGEKQVTHRLIQETSACFMDSRFSDNTQIKQKGEA